MIAKFIRTVVHALKMAPRNLAALKRERTATGLTFDEFTSAQKYVVLANAGAFFDGLDGDVEFGKALASQGVPLAGGANGRVTWSKPAIANRDKV